MNLARYISERWFWISLYALVLTWIAYNIATDPGWRPTERVEAVEDGTAPERE